MAVPAGTFKKQNNRRVCRTRTRHDLSGHGIVPSINVIVVHVALSPDHNVAAQENLNRIVPLSSKESRDSAAKPYPSSIWPQPGNGGDVANNMAGAAGNTSPKKRSLYPDKKGTSVVVRSAALSKAEENEIKRRKHFEKCSTKISRAETQLRLLRNMPPGVVKHVLYVFQG